MSQLKHTELLWSGTTACGCGSQSCSRELRRGARPAPTCLSQLVSRTPVATRWWRLVCIYSDGIFYCLRWFLLWRSSSIWKLPIVIQTSPNVTKQLQPSWLLSFQAFLAESLRRGGWLCLTVSLELSCVCSSVYREGFYVALSNLPGNIFTILLMDSTGGKILLCECDGCENHLSSV